MWYYIYTGIGASLLILIAIRVGSQCSLCLKWIVFEQTVVIALLAQGPEDNQQSPYALGSCCSRSHLRFRSRHVANVNAAYDWHLVLPDLFNELFHPEFFCRQLQVFSTQLRHLPSVIQNFFSASLRLRQNKLECLYQSTTFRLVS